MPWLALAETSTNMTSPPNSSATRPYSVSWVRTLVGNIGDLRTTGAHCGERLVPRRIDERDCTVFVPDLGMNLIGANVLRDAAGFRISRIRFTNRVQ